MSKRRNKRKTLREKNSAGSESGKSWYAVKRRWLGSHYTEIPGGLDKDGSLVVVRVHPFGFQVPEPKSWKGGY